MKRYAVVDVEALVMRQVDIVEQVALIIVNENGVELLAEKHMVYQPFNILQLHQIYGIDLRIIETAVQGYQMVTGDYFIHPFIQLHERWNEVRRRIGNLCKTTVDAVFAKGTALECRVFYKEFPIIDLACYGVPKYPKELLHDPLAECRYFGSFLPQVLTQIKKCDA